MPDDKDDGYRVFHNFSPDSIPVRTETVPKDVLKADFARRLNRLMVQKGWSQSEFARQTAKHTPTGHSPVTRDLINKYIGGKVLPLPANLEIICKTLGVERADLLPLGATKEAGSDVIPPIDVRDAGNNMAWVRVNQAVEWPVALKIMNLLKGR